MSHIKQNKAYTPRWRVSAWQERQQRIQSDLNKRSLLVTFFFLSVISSVFFGFCFSICCLRIIFYSLVQVEEDKRRISKKDENVRQREVNNQK